LLKHKENGDVLRDLVGRRPKKSTWRDSRELGISGQSVRRTFN